MEEEMIEFSESTNFWIIRAEGGNLYDDFIDDNYIGIRYNEVTVSDILNIDYFDIEGLDPVNSIRKLYYSKYRKYIKNDSDELSSKMKQRLTEHAKQAFLFTKKMNVGDYVIVPGKRSKEFAIGCIISNPFDIKYEKIQQRIKSAESDGREYKISDFIKRRKVKWISTLKRTDLPSFLSWTINAHQAIKLVTYRNESEFVKMMTLVTPIFKYNSEVFVNIHVNKGGELTLKDWDKIVNCAPNISGSIRMKADVNSPGFLLLSTQLINIDNLDITLKYIFGIYDQIKDNYFIDFLILTLFFGNDIFPKGIIGKFQDYNRKHLENQGIKLDNQRKKLELDKLKTSTAESVAEDLGLSIVYKGKRIHNGSNK